MELVKSAVKETEPTVVYIVCQSTDPVQIQGVFSTKEKAIAACKDEYDSVCPLNMDEELPRDETEWEGAFFPLFKGNIE